MVYLWVLFKDCVDLNDSSIRLIFSPATENTSYITGKVWVNLTAQVTVKTLHNSHLDKVFQTGFPIYNHPVRLYRLDFFKRLERSRVPEFMETGVNMYFRFTQTISITRSNHHFMMRPNRLVRPGSSKQAFLYDRRS